MTKAIKSLKVAEEYILNSLSYTYSSGVIEGINNKIKVIRESLTATGTSFISVIGFLSNSICFRQYKKTNPKREKFSSGVCECGSLISTDKMSHQHHLTESPNYTIFFKYSNQGDSSVAQHLHTF